MTTSAIFDRSIIAVRSLGHSIIVILCFLFDLKVIGPTIFWTLFLVKCLIRDLITEDLPEEGDP